jgi:hypothetical protein
VKICLGGWSGGEVGLPLGLRPVSTAIRLLIDDQNRQDKQADVD